MGINLNILTNVVQTSSPTYFSDLLDFGAPFADEGAALAGGDDEADGDGWFGHTAAAAPCAVSCVLNVLQGGKQQGERVKEIQGIVQFKGILVTKNNTHYLYDIPRGWDREMIL